MREGERERSEKGGRKGIEKRKKQTILEGKNYESKHTRENVWRRILDFQSMLKDVTGNYSYY